MPQASEQGPTGSILDTVTRLDDKFFVDRVPLSQLFVDHSYAREMTPARIRKWDKKHYDDLLAGVLYVSYRNGTGRCALVDGQGRVYAAQRDGIPTVPCRVYMDLSLAEESALYLATNRDRAPTTALGDFTARLVQGDEVAQSINALVTSIPVGLRIGPGGHSRTIAAVSALENVYRAWGSENLRYTLQLILDVWDGHKSSFTSEMILGFAAFLARVPILEAKAGRKWSRDQFVERLKKLGEHPAELKGRARQQAAVSPGMGPESAVGRALLAEYDRGRRDDMKLGGPRSPQGWPEHVISPAGTEVLSQNAVKATEKNIARHKANGKAKRAA